MRIISGIFKGHRLCAFSADFIRPMTDRVKTSVFNTLYSAGKDPNNKRVLDLFSGTGSLALESVSRGAQQAYLIDKNRKSIQIIKKNCQKLKIKTGIKIYQKDVFSFLATYKGKPFELIFADPPFKQELGSQILQHIVSSAVISKDTLLILELPIREEVLETSNNYHIFTKKKFGDKKVLFYKFN